MAFAVEDYYDLLRLISERPEWQAQLRQAILPNDFRSLPEVVRELVEAQRRTEATLDRFAAQTEARLGRLEERTERLEERTGRLEEAMVALTERTGRLEEAMAALTERTARLEEAMVALTERTGRLEEAIARLIAIQEGMQAQMRDLQSSAAKSRGTTLEWRYRDKAPGYFATALRRARAVPTEDLADMVEGKLSEEEWRDVVLTDLVVRGRLCRPGETPEVLLAVEVSATLDEEDVIRAARRATLLRKAGFSAIPVIAGEATTLRAEDEARALHAAIVQDESSRLWEDALDAWPPLE